MWPIIEIVLAILAVGIFAWLMYPSKNTADENRVIDPNDARQIGLLIGMTGGSIATAAAAQFALRRFEEVHGRKATVKEMGLVAGMMRSER